MNIYYGIQNNCIDVTNVCMEKLKNGDIIIIPHNEHTRSRYFTDPLIGVHKFVIINGNMYDDNLELRINVASCEITQINANVVNNAINNKLRNIHANLVINYGDLSDELPEQKMSVRYLNGNEKVLEIGGNVGRNSLVIASLLNDSTNLVTLECDPITASQLEENKLLNNLNFNIECSALSNRTLIQQNWDTIPSNELISGYNWVNTITFEELNVKYNLNFDTLVIDCEGAFYYILMDMPEILNGINLIIMENDYHNIDEKIFIDNVLMNNNFVRDYIESGGWGPCYDNFFEVWKKI
jgi:FkbM family methyltransferase